MGDPVAGDRVEDDGEIDVAQHHVVRAVHQPEECPAGAGDVEQRHRDEADRVLVESEGLARGGDERGEVRAREHRALREAGRARCVELDRDVVGRGRVTGIAVGLRVAPGTELVVTRVSADREDERIRRQRRFALVQDREEVAPHDQDAGAGVVHDVRDLGGGQPPVDRAQHRTDLRRAEHELEQLEGVPVEEGDTVAAPDALGPQAVRDSVRGRVEVAVRHIAPFEGERDVVTDRRCLRADQIREGLRHHTLLRAARRWADGALATVALPRGAPPGE